MSHTKSLSDLWRENRSKDPGVDLASILDGCRILAQSLSPKTEVTFAGISTADTDGKNIRLSAKMIGNEYPVPGDMVDVILGLTVHEVGHNLFSTDKIEYTNRILKKVGAYYHGAQEEKSITRLIGIFEDIYIDHLMTAYPGYRDYLARSRVWSLGNFNPDSVSKPLEAKCTRMDMLNAMCYLTLCGGKVPQNISQDNMAALGKIATLANKMCTKQISKEKAVLGAWNVLKGLPMSLSDEERGLAMSQPEPAGKTEHGDEEEPDAKPVSEQVKDDVSNELDEQEKLDEADEDGEEGQEEEEVGEGEGKGQDIGDEEQETGEDEEQPKNIEAETSGESDDDTGEEKEDRDIAGEAGTDIDPDLDMASMLDDLVNDYTALPKNIAEEVREAIIENRSDLTQLVSHLAKDSRYTVVAYTPGEDAQASAEARCQTASVEEALRKILQDYRLRRTKDFRGLMSGRVSARRLHRVAYGDQRVFQRRERPEEIDLAVCLLMDLSGSVQCKRGLISQIVCAICDAFQKEKVEFIALGYSERGGTVSIPRLYDREIGRVNIKLDKEWGMTPSYEGLAAAIAQLLRLTGTKEKILFHFTDGDPNVGGAKTIPELLEIARSNKITDIHVCLSSSLGLRQIENFSSLYGSNAMVIDDISQLPEIIEQELRLRLKI